MGKKPACLQRSPKGTIVACHVLCSAPSDMSPIIFDIKFGAKKDAMHHILLQSNISQQIILLVIDSIKYLIIIVEVASDQNGNMKLIK